ncbi:undecaprenyl-diphosphatase [Paraperlucidibaca baekdonensis]|uniref:Undecaprenyl-diphosphatase n=1 Tax=Paraperlucidibaca baekdonensis TaxID=748120 RepID=A0A3E0H3P9_9GAMM|nr:undecaprenyl-diphosphate phosphatase [Paraperlucidibaca baekdonensis]REH37917.1 undecaprenyl-diphosphatase [Paraperlucidibaca baekdonensis]
MDYLLYFQALVMGIVEGLTEFLPISSTGHLILAGELMNFWTHDKRVVFEIAIQLGAILAVCWDYRERLVRVSNGFFTRKPVETRFVVNILVAFLPAAVIGFFAIGIIRDYLFSPFVVAFMLILGGLVILWAERREHVVRVVEVDDMRWQDALKVGFAQCLAMVPGTSRSGATIIGGLLVGLSRKTAAEFSFFLAVPTMIGATVYSVYKHRTDFVMADFPVFAIGFVAAFLVAAWVVKALVAFVSTHGFAVFAYYRIAFGLFIFATAGAGWINWAS